MTQERPPRPRLGLVPPVPREDADDTPTRVNGNGHGTETPTNPPHGPRLSDLDPEELEQETAMTVGIISSRLKVLAKKLDERDKREAGRVDALITSDREKTVALAELKAELLEVKATGLSTNAGVFELVAAHREQAKRSGTIALDASQAKQVAAVSRAEALEAKKLAAKAQEDAALAIRKAQAALDAETRSSKTDQEILDAVKVTTVDLVRGRAATVVKTEASTAALTIESKTTDVVVDRKWRLGRVALYLSAAGGVIAAATKLILFLATKGHP